MWAAWRARLSRLDLLFEASFMGGMVAAYAVFLWLLPPTDVVVILVAKTESVTFEVADAGRAAFRVTGMRLGGRDGACRDGVVTPRAGSRVEYRRGGPDYFHITVNPAGGETEAVELIEPGAAEGTPMRGSVVFSAEGCPGTPAAIYPVAGPAQFGEPARSVDGTGRITPGALGSGAVSVFARSHARLLGFTFPRLIYRVTSFDLPPGSRLSTLEQGVGAEDTTWLGSLRVGASQDGFTVEASTSARRLRLDLSGAASPDNAGNLVDLGSYPQFLNDPNLIVLQFIWGGLIAVFHFTRPFLTGLRARQDSPTSEAD